MIYDEATVLCVLGAARDDHDWQAVAINNNVHQQARLRPCGLPGDPARCQLLEEMNDALDARFSLRVTRQTIKRHLDARRYTVKQTHRDNNYRNLAHKKSLRQRYVIDLLSYKSQGKKIFYVDETNFNLWRSRRRGRSLRGTRAVDRNTASKGSNIHVIACISEDGFVYTEKRFGSFTPERCGVGNIKFCVTLQGCSGTTYQEPSTTRRDDRPPSSVGKNALMDS
ncbi:hypothetical protein PHYSODRAFT_343090 [Phytophthora sojae]|uniref:Tc1-like transposase DDE domain-containing protein n=1 Tax=Phytophthora sojae (strain P6497) TaxID=1094619 RepID=G5AIL1_PHYSP|nr:hypothetical protein PHYSODRAFT_343090 [Phytophthora sojae]EGZ04621.1 hypothetical protein PHYSODRAFT_343090 [Phytophthora sojae]|eukprot:XP_009539912.1 hypothetical protein PHYSODRAFT_343090 [Phytophthora sojae]